MTLFFFQVLGPLGPLPQGRPLKTKSCCFLLLPKKWRIEQNHADDNQNAQDCPSDLYFLLMFFVKNHILNISHHEKFSTGKKI